MVRTNLMSVPRWRPSCKTEIGIPAIIETMTFPPTSIDDSSLSTSGTLCGLTANTITSESWQIKVNGMHTSKYLVKQIILCSDAQERRTLRPERKTFAQFSINGYGLRVWGQAQKMLFLFQICLRGAAFVQQQLRTQLPAIWSNLGRLRWL